MLALTRKAGERILIGPDIEVHIVWIQGDRVRVGIAAPREVIIRRSEVPLKKKGMTRREE